MTDLRDIGLTEYEARVYRTLLSTGPTTASELSNASGVPSGRIYDVLSELETKRMLRIQNANTPKVYAPVDPETALDRRVEDKRREMATIVEAYEQTATELSERLDATNPDEEFWTVAMGPEDSLSLLEDRLRTANERVIIVANAPSTAVDMIEMGDRISAALETVVEQGVEASILLDREVVQSYPDVIHRRHRRLLAEYPNCELRVGEGITGSFTLIDRAEICVSVPNPLADGETLALIDLTDPAFATRAAEVFDPHWAAAESVPSDGAEP